MVKGLIVLAGLLLVLTLPVRAAPPRSVSALPSRIDPQSAKAGTPERSLLEYLAAWQNQNWSRMAGATRLTWRLSQPDTDGTLQRHYGTRRLISARIAGKKLDHSTTAHVQAILSYREGPAIRNQTINALVVREKTAHTPSWTGFWGVDPTSTQDVH